MYELNNKIRLINVRDYCVEEAKEFVGLYALSYFAKLKTDVA